ncbi:glycerophosphodiester phosphodiesterase [Algoriphagus namhaensis]
MIRHSLAVILFFCFFHTSGQEILSNFAPENFEQHRFAHRGGYASGPENTLQTILTNLNSGTTAIEIDVQLTKDGQLVLFHDETISRVLKSENDMLVSELSLAELKEIPLRDTSQDMQQVASLEELIDTLTILVPQSQIDDFVLEIDFKPHGKQTRPAVEALLKLLEPYADHFGDQLYNHFFVSTFYPEVLKEIHQMAPQVVTAFAVNNSPDQDRGLAKLAIFLAPVIIKKYKVKIIEPSLCMVDDQFVRKWQKKGILINAYTANTACQKNYLRNFPIAFTTNCPGNYCQLKPSDQVNQDKNWCRDCS